jgi:hypothetical protein
MKVKGSIGRWLVRTYRLLHSLLSAKILIGVRGNDEFCVELVPIKKSGIDERIAQIDSAKRNLVAALSAVDDIKTAAQENREDLNDALRWPP